MDSPVRRGFIARGDKYGVALRNGDTEEVDGRLLNIHLSIHRKAMEISIGEVHIWAMSRSYTVDFNYAHIMAIYPEEECGECGGIDDAQTVCLPRLKWERCVLIEPHSCGDRGRRTTWDGAQIRGILGKVYQARIWQYGQTNVRTTRGGEIPGTGSTPSGFSVLVNCLSST